MPAPYWKSNPNLKRITERQDARDAQREQTPVCEFTHRKCALWGFDHRRMVTCCYHQSLHGRDNAIGELTGCPYDAVLPLTKGK